MRLFADYGYVVVVDSAFLKMTNAKPICTCKDKRKHEIFIIYYDESKDSYYASREE